MLSSLYLAILHPPSPSWSANEPILYPSRKFLFAPSCPALFDLDLQIATQYFAEISGWFQDHHRLEAFLHSHSYLRHPSAHFSCNHFTGNSDITPTGQQLAMFQILSPSCISIPSAHMAKLAPIFQIGYLKDHFLRSLVYLSVRIVVSRCQFLRTLGSSLQHLQVKIFVEDVHCIPPHW